MTAFKKCPLLENDTLAAGFLCVWESASNAVAEYAFFISVFADFSQKEDIPKPEYMGDTVNFRSHRASCKEKKNTPNPRDEWLILVKTHGPAKLAAAIRDNGACYSFSSYFSTSISTSPSDSKVMPLAVMGV